GVDGADAPEVERDADERGGWITPGARSERGDGDRHLLHLLEAQASGEIGAADDGGRHTLARHPPRAVGEHPRLLEVLPPQEAPDPRLGLLDRHRNLTLDDQLARR